MSSIFFIKMLLTFVSFNLLWSSIRDCLTDLILSFTVIGALAYWICGFAFAYGVAPDELNNVDSFIGHRYFLTINLPSGEQSSWFFQFVFAATSSTIVSGGIAERTKFCAYVGK